LIAVQTTKGDSEMSNVINNVSEMPVVFYRFSVHGKADKKNVRSMSQQTEATASAEKGTVTTLVRNIPVCFSAPIKRIEGQIRNLFYNNGIQLGDSFGVPIAVLPVFKSKLDALRQEYALHFSNMVTAAENGTLQAMALKELADLGDKVAIPTVEQIREGYGVDVRTSLNIDTPAVASAMALLSDDLKAQLKTEIEESAKKEHAEQLASVTGVVVDTIKAFLEDVETRCAVDPKGIQFKTMTDKLAHIVNVLPAYNLTQNAELANLIETVRTKFANMNKDVLKVDPTARQKAVDMVTEIKSAFATMF
jgi:hypothetical protein